MQGQGHGGTQYTGVFDVVKHLYREGGLRSVFRGSAATVARDGPGSAAYFAAYELTKRALTPAGSDPGELNLGAIIMAGGTAGIAMWSIAIPPDVSRSTRSRTECSYMTPGFEVEDSICTNGDVFWLHGLCTQDYCGRWCRSVVERSRACYGESEFADTRLLMFSNVYGIAQAFPANAATFVSVIACMSCSLLVDPSRSWVSKRHGNSWTSTSDDLRLTCLY